MSPSALASPVSPRSAIAFSSACFGMGRSETQVHFKRNPRFLDCSESAADHEPMVESNQHDGDRLRQLMARAGVTQAKVAEAMGVSPTAVGSKWLTQGAIARHHIANLCALLNCTSDELLGIIPIAPRAGIAESRAPYLQTTPMRLTQREAALIENYRASAERFRQIVDDQAAASAQPDDLNMGSG